MSATRRLPDAVRLRWAPVPRRPWRIEDADGRLIRGFDQAELAQAWLECHGYVVTDAIVAAP